MSPEHQSWGGLQDDLGFNFEASFQQSCGYLLKIDGKGFVGFAHQTVKEFLEKITPAAREVDEQIIGFYRVRPKDIDVEIVTVCITLLQFIDFDENNVGESLVPESKMYYNGSGEFRERILRDTSHYPLLGYAFRFWYHFDDSFNECYVSNTLRTFFQSTQANFFRLAAAPWTRPLQDAVPRTTALLPIKLPALHHCIQSEDFPKTVLSLIDNGAEVNKMDTDHLTPLHWACARGHHKTIKVLLDVPKLNINKGLSAGYKPIHVALEWLAFDADQERHSIPLKLLGDPRIDINAPGVRRSRIGKLRVNTDLVPGLL